MGTPIAAQTLPQLPPGVTTAEAIRLFNTSPEFRNFVRVRLLSSGLTPEQMRSQLVAAGYPASMLDGFLAAEGLAPEQNDEQLTGALSALGIQPVPQSSVTAVSDSAVAARDASTAHPPAERHRSAAAL